MALLGLPRGCKVVVVSLGLGPGGTLAGAQVKPLEGPNGMHARARDGFSVQDSVS